MGQQDESREATIPLTEGMKIPVQTADRVEEERPTIGRIVLFNAGFGKVLPAIVTHVWNNTCVNLFVLADGSYPDATSGPQTSVVRGGDFMKWEWPRQATSIARSGRVSVERTGQV